jgi:hypothetical protein
LIWTMHSFPQNVSRQIWEGRTAYVPNVGGVPIRIPGSPKKARPIIVQVAKRDCHWPNFRKKAVQLTWVIRSYDSVSKRETTDSRKPNTDGSVSFYTFSHFECKKV